MEKVVFYGENETIDEILEDKYRSELELFKIALKKYVEDLDNESIFKMAMKQTKMGRRSMRAASIIGFALFAVIFGVLRLVI